MTSGCYNVNLLFYPSKAQIETQKAAIRFENACNAHRKAKEMVAFAEQRLFSSSSSDHCVLDPALQEMLNHATIRVMIILE